MLDNYQSGGIGLWCISISVKRASEHQSNEIGKVLFYGKSVVLFRVQSLRAMVLLNTQRSGRSCLISYHSIQGLSLKSLKSVLMQGPAPGSIVPTQLHYKSTPRVSLTTSCQNSLSQLLQLGQTKPKRGRKTVRLFAVTVSLNGPMVQ